jgi:hypothetical protein
MTARLTDWVILAIMLAGYFVVWYAAKHLRIFKRVPVRNAMFF